MRLLQPRHAPLPAPPPNGLRSQQGDNSGQFRSHPEPAAYYAPNFPKAEVRQGLIHRDMPDMPISGPEGRSSLSRRYKPPVGNRTVRARGPKGRRRTASRPFGPESFVLQPNRWFTPPARVVSSGTCERTTSDECISSKRPHRLMRLLVFSRRCNSNSPRRVSRGLPVAAILFPHSLSLCP